MTRCIFRKPKRRLKLSEGLGVVTVMLEAALCLELQSELNPKPSTMQRTTLLGERGTMEGWRSNSSSRLPQ
jgi:hypothetical protein